MSVQKSGAEEFFRDRSQFYSNPKNEFENRTWEWLTESGIFSRDANVTHLEAMALGGIVCGVLGAGIGTSCGPIGTGVGFGIGVPTGIALGYAYVESLKVVHALPEYEAYKKTAEGKQFAKDLDEIFKRDASREEVRCPWTSEFLRDAVYLQGYKEDLYERNLLEIHIEKTGKHPVTQDPITKNSILSAGEQVNFLSSVACLKFMRGKREEFSKIRPDMLKGFDIIIGDYENKFTNQHSKESIQLSEALNSSKINARQYQAQMKIINDKYFI